jgi:RND family efflux transporter MFP subunit
LQQIEAQKMTIQKYERSHKQMLASLQAQKEQLRYYQITAPFAGVIGDVPVKVGDHVTSATALTSLTENHPLEAYISVPAEKASAMHEGINVALAGANGDEYGESKVIFVSPTVDPASQTVLVKALYPNSKSELRAEQTVKAVVVWRQKNGISVPTDVVKQAAGKFFVFLAENSSAANTVAKQAEIEVEGIEGSEYQVKSGLKAGDRVITSGIQRLADGMPVTVKAALEKGNESTATNNKLQTH